MHVWVWLDRGLAIRLKLDLKLIKADVLATSPLWNKVDKGECLVTKVFAVERQE
jgi:hypothetical protein